MGNLGQANYSAATGIVGMTKSIAINQNGTLLLIVPPDLSNKNDRKFKWAKTSYN